MARYYRKQSKPKQYILSAIVMATNTDENTILGEVQVLWSAIAGMGNLL